jgi:hypothetical protein
MKQVVLVILLLQTAFCVKAQIYMEPYTGFQMDLNNTDPHFKQINSGVQFSFKSKGTYELVLQLQHSWPLTYNSSDSAFTPNPSLPVFVNAPKKIQPSSSSFAVMHRIVVAGKNTPNTFYAIISTGLVYQKMKVTYTYDKANYSILNPDKTQERTRGYFGFGILYMRQLQKGRFFTELDFNTPPIGPKIKYPSTFKFMAPAALNIGYSFKISNK